jgi:stage II sporulation protein D
VPANPVTYNKKAYRGEIAVVISKAQKLSLVNVLNLDEYLLGVVPEEMPSGWSLEALKAQAVAARTYSLSHLGRWADEGFDMVATTSDQAYGGLSEERPQTNQAVMATRGQVLTYNGKLISAMYSSSSGGYTENNEIVLANATPAGYLRGVPDFDNVQGNTNFAWTRVFTIEDFARYLKSDVGTVTGVAPAGPIGVSGRPSAWTITGTTATKTVPGSQLRNLPGVISNPKGVTLQAGGLSPASQSFAANGSFFVMGAGGIMNRPAQGTSVLSAPKAFSVVAGAVSAIGAKVSQPTGVTVTGGGSGHAIGMSQWGAYGMAQQGKTYVEILTHYYTGTQLETRQTTP